MWDARLRVMMRWALLIVTVFNALSALVSGVAMLLTDGLGMPLSFLETSPFTSFLWPGVVLVVVVGGTQALAAVLLTLRREAALLWSAVAGFGLLIWIFIETGLIREWSWLQVLYFATGAIQLALVLGLLGIVAWLPRLPLDASGSPNAAGRGPRP